MLIVCSDLEGVFVPEIWINVAERTGIEALRLTTRDIADYDVLMKKRLGILAANNLKLRDITDVIATMEPLPGAVEFVQWLRSRTQLIVLSDTFEEFARPLLAKLGFPTLLCHSLSVDAEGRVSDYILRQHDPKMRAVQAFKALNYEVIAMGDSYNDTSMLQAADRGFLFCPPDNVVAEFPQFQVARSYEELKALFAPILGIA
jgi:phosphoserine / homoserine phosphotransferase